MDNCEKVGLVIGCMSVILDILGIAIPYWSYISVDGAGGNSGLWIACGSASSLGYICLPYITDVSLLPPPPSYDECSKYYPPHQANDPAPSGYPGIQPTAIPGYTGGQSMGYAAQPGFQPGFLPPLGFQQGASPFFHQGQPWYPTPQPHPNRPHPQGSYSDQQPYRQLITGQPYTSTEDVVTHPVQQQGNGVTTRRPPDYMTAASLATICFCPIGFAAIFHAADANKMALTGNMDGARPFAEAAKGLISISFVVGGIIISLAILVTVYRSG